MKTARKSTNSYTYECPDCGLKFAVGDQIVIGTMTPEHLKRRGGRRPGHCHCGHKFATEFHDKKNAMWRMPIGKMGMKGAEPAAPVFPLRSLPRVRINSSSQESPQILELRERLANDPPFADSILATAERVALAMASSTDDSKREEGRKRLRPILKARRDLKTRVHSTGQDSSEGSDEAMPTHYRPSLETVPPIGIASNTEEASI